ncbi:hypothetical protein GA0115240_15305 [Streptomyces sp. DvalAA-14]|uniref:hypothetical protein n=1 Tax=unclassified Streptomyces TaxID=2593676 RepID=UPI00081B84DC|nr:hypothetical protein [Streptomyces sp. DvalAA-14]SCE34120.1 hypothetical protein GA0115240_15305 [Streptomyces sp. DvalAA-14]
MVDTQKLPHSSEPDTGVSPHCDLVRVPSRQGLEAVDILRFSAGGVGPVLHDRTGDSLSFLVPPGTADAWNVPGSSCAGRTEDGETAGAGWLVPPHTDTAVTDPAVLEAALGEAARMLRLADGWHPAAAEGCHSGAGEGGCGGVRPADR